jgi:hypothetical protein
MLLCEIVVLDDEMIRLEGVLHPIWFWMMK